MIALWRRVRRRIIHGVGGIGDTEWALLGFETLGVIGGVFLAFQLGSWVEDRREAGAQRAQLERLHQESEETVRFLRFWRDDFNQSEDRIAAALDGWINAGTCPSAEDWQAFRQMDRLVAITPQRAAYEEMLGSGGMGRLDDPRVREAISDFYSTLDFHDQQLAYFRQTALNDFRDFDYGQDYGFDAETRSARQEDGWQDTACRDRDHRNQTARKFASFKWLQDLREELTGDAIKMCIAIAGELGEDCVPTDGGALSAADRKQALEVLGEKGN